MSYLNFDDVPLDPRVTSAGAVDPDALRAKGMGEIGKGWASGRLGNEINTLRSQEASLRADNDVKGGDALNARVQALKQRQGLYAPEVGKVEDIDGFGKAASWLGGQVGQGAASSIDQLVTGTAIGGAATLAGLIPHRGAQALSKGLRLAAPTAMYAQSVPLMKGESYDAMTQDPAIMAGHTPQELNDSARNHGMASALLDTAVPGYMAHSLAGGGLKKGLRALNPMQHAGAQMFTEGATETGQEMIKNRALTELNANRDTSGDNSAYLNSFAGGAAGSSHMALGSSLADAGFRRVGDTAEKLGTKMGEGFDLAADTAAPMMKRGKDAVTDLMAGEDGKVSAASIMDNLKAGARDMKSSAQSKLDEHNILTGAIPDELMADETPAGMAKLGAWLAQNDTKRAALVVDKLEGMEQDPVALQHLDALDAAQQDPDQYNQAVGAAAEYVLEQTPMGRAQSRADTFGENMGKLASVVGPAVGRGVVATGRAALKFGKSVLSGAQDGMAKKNMQADETSANPRAELAGGYAADMAQRSAPQNKNLAGLARHLAFSLADMIDSTDTGGAKVMDKAGIDARVTRLNRIVSDFHDIYKKNAPEVLRQLGSILGPNSGEAVTHMLSELEQRTAPGGQRRFVESRDALAQQVVGLVDPAAQVKLMAEGINLNTPRGREQLLGLMEDYADGIGSGPGARQALDQHFGKESVQSILTLLNGQEEKEKVGSVVDDRQTTTTESVDPNTDDETDEAPNAHKVALEDKNQRNSASPPVYAFGSGLGVRLGGETRHPFGATKKVDKATQQAREANGEVGAPLPTLFKKDERAYDKNTKRYDGPVLSDKRMDELKKEMGLTLDEDGTPSDHEVGLKSAHEVMTELNMQPSAILALYRDYLRQEAATPSGRPDAATPAERTAMMQKAASVGKKLKGDTLRGMIKTAEEGGARLYGPQAAAVKAEIAKLTAELPRMSINEGKQREELTRKMVAEGADGAMTTDEYATAEVLKEAKAFFSERHVVVAKQMVNAIPEKVTFAELQKMSALGRRALDNARKNSLVGGQVDEVEHMQQVSDANIVEFPLEGGKHLPIPAGSLINWMRSQDGKYEQEGEKKSLSDADKNKAYREDLMRAVGMVMTSGMVDGWPHKMNPNGEEESFADGTPPSLRLYSGTQWEDERAIAEKRDKQQSLPGQGNLHKFQGADQGRVAADQARNEEYFVPEYFVPGDDSAVPVVGDPAGKAPPRYVGSNRLSPGAEASPSIVRKHDIDKHGKPDGEKFAAQKISTSDDDSRTAIDRSKGQAEGQQWDEITDIEKRTQAQMDAFEKPKTRMAAMRASKRTAEGITAMMMNDSQVARGVIMSHIRVAMQEGGFNTNGTVGDAYHIAPIVRLVSADNVTAFRNAGAQPNLIDGMQRAALHVLIRAIEGRADITEGNITTLAKMLPGVPANVMPNGLKKVLQGQLAQRGEIDFAQLNKIVSPKIPGAPKLNVGQRPLGDNPSRAAAHSQVEMDGMDTTVGPKARVKSMYRRTPTSLNSGPGTPSRTVSQGFVDKQTALVKARPPALPMEEEAAPQRSLFDPVSSPIAGKRGPMMAASARAAAVDEAVLNETYPETVAGVDRFLKAAKTRFDGLYADMSVESSAYDKKVYNALQEWFGDGSMADLESFYPHDAEGRSDDEVRAMLAGKSAPEVANAGLPKGQATLSGVNNRQHGNARAATQADMDAAKAYALKVLGPKIQVEFKDIVGYSGEFIDAKNIIEISTTAAAGTLGTLYHEAMHVFFRDFVKGNPKMIATFESLINDPKHIAKLEALLDKYPAAKAQLHGPGSGEERLAYTYQFWKAGLLQVDAKASTWLQKVGKFFRRVLGHVRDSERALELFQAFDNGKMSEPSAAGRVIAAAMGRGGNAMKFRRQFDGVMQGVAALTMPAGEILAKSVSPTARRLSTMMFTNPGEEAHGQEETGLMNARHNVSRQYNNITNRKFETMSSVDQNAVQKYLQSEADLHDIPNADHRAAVKDVRAVLDRFHQYMTDAGMKIGKVEKYYPTVWSAAALNDKKAEFIKMLVTKYPQQMNPNGGNAQKSAERIWRSLVDKEGVDAHLPAGREDGVLSPFFASQEMRTLPWLDGADKEKFLEKNMPLTLTRYFSQGAHATEYFRRFGENGKRLEVMLSSINKELSTAGRQMMARGEIKDEDARVKWVSRQMRDVSQSVGAMEGSLGKDVSPNMRKFNSWMAVYQNIRVLPMALFSSFVDPLAMVARGAPMQAAYETFVYGMREVFRGWSDAFKDMPPERVKDEWRQLAEHIGASEIAMFQHHVADEYASAYMSSGAKKINDKMFVLNGMEAWNRGSRIMATKWAVRFLEKHAGLPDKNHSERWLAELGLKPSMITLDGGNLVTDRHALATLKNISLEQATKEIAHIHDALNRWVEGAVLTPNAAQRPAWSSDPNWATLFHLKQFSYSFHQTILKRAVNEFKHGNMAPVGALAAFIPTMITADIIKGLIQGGGSLPPYMASMNAGDWFTHGVQRAGLSGIGVIGMDAANDWSSLGGPAFEQIVDAARDGFGSKSALHAMPLNSLYGRMLAGNAAAPLTT